MKRKRGCGCDVINVPDIVTIAAHRSSAISDLNREAVVSALTRRQVELCLLSITTAVSSLTFNRATAKTSKTFSKYFDSLGEV